ncbi:MAG: SsrA-binding protein SmpB [Acidimicrobiia bacterium]|nr:SsrA-binding protein SmpB [Acidimicrobiia bacterium]MBT8213707.1 SsrA-binding protein SmpB [Acidimicrobiia bacterium]NNF70279.1 SsrA-binding protein SmpB [Acidimicrobiia bacterium]NNK91361.1 SsrA-binding protein SmpB [Acidimicrobiia bacterium]
MSRQVVATNRKARHDYEIIDTFEAGIVLTGSEVKSLRDKQLTLKDAYADIVRGELWLMNAHIAPYSYAREGGHDPERHRKLLVHRSELERLVGKLAEQGLTLIPTQVYFSDGLAKVELALAKGRKRHDKRRQLRDKEDRREMRRLRR